MWALLDKVLGKPHKEGDDGRQVTTLHGRPIVQSFNSLPDQWVWFPPEGEEHAVAEQLCDGQGTRAQLEERLHVVRPEMNLEQFAGTAIWVPQRDSSDIQGDLQAKLIIPDEGELERASMDQFRQQFEPEQRPNWIVYSQAIEEVELRAGPALVLRESKSWNEASDSDEAGVVSGSIIYWVFPPGSTDILGFSFRTLGLEWLENLAAEAAWIADTLEITLGERV